MTDDEITRALEVARQAIAALPWDRRVEEWQALMAGHCRHCGMSDEMTGGNCQCWNDE